MDALTRANELRYLQHETIEIRYSAILEVAVPILKQIERRLYTEEEAADAASIILDLVRDLRL